MSASRGKITGNLLKPEVVSWLLEPDNPSVRYFTLTDLLHKAPGEPDVVSARQAIMASRPVRTILDKQSPDGSWGKPADFYEHSKYRGTVWNIILLAHLGVDPRDPRIRAAGEFILANSQHIESGSFAVTGGEKGGDTDWVIPCLTGNMVFSLLRFGLMGDDRVQHAIDWMARYQRFDDKDCAAPTGWPYQRERCWGRHTCTMGVVKSLKALAEIPPTRRSPEVKACIDKGAEYLLKHHLFKRSHQPDRVAKPEWTSFGFPLMWKTDALEMLDVMLKLGYRDTRMQDAVDLVLSKQDAEGRWPMEVSLNGRMLVRFEANGEPSRWVTLRALTALQAWLSA